MRDLHTKTDHYVFEGMQAFMNELISRGGSVLGVYAHLPNQAPKYLGHEGVQDVLKEKELTLSALAPPAPRVGNVGRKLPNLDVDWKHKGHNYFRPQIKKCCDIIVGRPGTKYKNLPTPAYWPRSVPYGDPSHNLTVKQCRKVIKHMYTWAKENNFLQEGYNPVFSDDEFSEPDEPPSEPEHQQEIGAADVPEGGRDVAAEESEDEGPFPGFAEEGRAMGRADVAEGQEDEENGGGYETEEVEEEIGDELEEESDSVALPQVSHGNDNESEDEEPLRLNVSGSRAPRIVVESDTDDDTVPEEHQVAGPSRERPRRSKRQKTFRE